MAGAPQQPPAVVLVGFMGAGKTAVGTELAVRLELPFLDTDAVIAAAYGPIPEIFAARGEAGFRVLEAETVVRELAALVADTKVLALGGGAVLSDDVRRELAAAAHVVWLTAPADVLWARVEAGDDRPLARDEASFRALLASREDLYREVATEVVDTNGLTPGGVAEEIARALGLTLRVSSPDPERQEGAA